MRFLFISNNFPPVVDGVGDYTYFFSSLLMERGHQVAVLCHQRVSGNLHSESVNIVSDVLYIDQKKINVFPTVKSWGSSWRKYLRNAIQIFNPDIVNLQYVPFAFHRFGIPVSLLLLPFSISKKKLIVTFHEVAVRDYLNGKWKSFMISVIQRVIANLLNLHSIMSFTSVEHYLQYFYIEKPTLLPIGNNLSLHVAPQEKVALTDEKIILATFGIRAYEIMLDTFTLVKEKASLAFQYQIIGKMAPEKIERLRTSFKAAGLEENVVITGFIPSEEVLRRLIGSHIFLELTFPDKDGRGGTNLKSGSFAAAVAAGLPSIGVKGDMTDHRLRHGENIWLCEKSTPEAVSDAIILLMNDADLRMRIRIGALELYHSHLSWDKIGDKYLSHISACLS